MAQSLEIRDADDTRPSLETRVTDLVVRLAFLALFAYWSLELVKPFLPVVIWSVLLAVALYPAYAWLARLLGGRRGVSAALITGLMLLIVIGPLSVLAVNMTESVQSLTASLQAGLLRVPPPPPRVAEWPLVGDKIAEAWSVASRGLDEAVQKFGPSLLPAGSVVLTKIAPLGGDLLKFVASVIIAGFLFLPGPRLAAGTRQFVARLVAPRGAQFVDMAGATIRNVSRGIIGVALLQTILADAVFQVGGVPAASLLAFAVLILCIAQIGPAPVFLGVIIWGWSTMTPLAALLLTIVLIPVGLLDNVLKPILMARGLETPTLIILTGVIGGTLTNGLIGLFLGPIVLAVFYELVAEWVQLNSSDTSEEQKQDSRTMT